MEPDVNTMITQKIRTLEREPVSWNKAEVWLKVQEQISTVRKSYWKYYAAATVIFFLFCNVYTLQQDHTIPVVAVNRNGKQAEMRTEKNPVVSESERAKKTATKPMHSQVKKAASENQFVVLTVDLSGQKPLNETEVTKVEVELHGENPPVGSIETVTEERIMPVVGVIRLPDKNYAETRPGRKKLFHKLEPSETVFDDSFKNTIITARIK
jgi:hypothetical protein